MRTISFHLGSGTEINTDMGDHGVDSLGRTYFDWFDTTIVINHDWGVDRFVAFCKKVGAEPDTSQPFTD
ncbi:MAG: hypothetical protein ACP5QG_06460 [candidate division WOR-3 bacterium]